MIDVYTFILIAGIGLGLLVVNHVVAYLRSPLKDVPGPFLAKFTNVWRLVDHYKATQINTQQRLHEELGPAVRIGPNFVSLSDPTLLKTVYSTRGEYLKVRHLPLTPMREMLSWGIGRARLAVFTATLTNRHRATSTRSMMLCKTATSSRMSLVLGATPSTAGT